MPGSACRRARRPPPGTGMSTTVAAVVPPPGAAAFQRSVIRSSRDDPKLPGVVGEVGLAPHVGDAELDPHIGLVGGRDGIARHRRAPSREPTDLVGRPLASAVPTVSEPRLGHRRVAGRERASGGPCVRFGRSALACTPAPAAAAAASRPSAADSRRWRPARRCPRCPSCSAAVLSSWLASTLAVVDDRAGRPWA